MSGESKIITCVNCGQVEIRGCRAKYCKKCADKLYFRQRTHDGTEKCLNPECKILIPAGSPGNRKFCCNMCRREAGKVKDKVRKPIPPKYDRDNREHAKSVARRLLAQKDKNWLLMTQMTPDQMARYINE